MNIRNGGIVDMKNPNVLSNVSIDGGTNGSISITTGKTTEALTIRSRMRLTSPGAGVFTGSTVVRVSVI